VAHVDHHEKEQGGEASRDTHPTDHRNDQENDGRDMVENRHNDEVVVVVA